MRIGAGAKILGNIRIGDFAVIGANAVVVKDVAPGAVVAGVPARELRREPNPAAAYKSEMGKAPPEVESMAAAFESALLEAANAEPDESGGEQRLAH